MKEVGGRKVFDNLEKRSRENVERKLRCHPTYPELFRKSFGIQNALEITRYMTAKAIAQFMRTMVSSGESKYDRVERGEAFFTEDELIDILAGFNIIEIKADKKEEHFCVLTQK